MRNLPEAGIEHGRPGQMFRMLENTENYRYRHISQESSFDRLRQRRVDLDLTPEIPIDRLPWEKGATGAREAVRTYALHMGQSSKVGYI